MMKPEVKAKWVAALRSGEYQQGQGGLLTVRDGNDLYCCLGVLCKVAEVPLTRTLSEGKVYGTFGYGDGGSSGFLPRNVASALGLNAENPYVCHPDYGNQTLAWLNDSGVPFSDLADLIEEQL